MEQYSNKKGHKPDSAADDRADDRIGITGSDSREPTVEAQSAMPPERKPIKDSISAAVLKHERNRDAAQAMKEHEAAKQETLAKTARLRAERLARDAKAASAIKLPAAKKR